MFNSEVLTSLNFLRILQHGRSQVRYPAVYRELDVAQSRARHADPEDRMSAKMYAWTMLEQLQQCEDSDKHDLDPSGFERLHEMVVSADFDDFDDYVPLQWAPLYFPTAAAPPAYPAFHLSSGSVRWRLRNIARELIKYENRLECTPMVLQRCFESPPISSPSAYKIADSLGKGIFGFLEARDIVKLYRLCTGMREVIKWNHQPQRLTIGKIIGDNGVTHEMRTAIEKHTGPKTVAIYNTSAEKDATPDLGLTCDLLWTGDNHAITIGGFSAWGVLDVLGKLTNEGMAAGRVAALNIIINGEPTCRAAGVHRMLAFITTHFGCIRKLRICQTRSVGGVQYNSIGPITNLRAAREVMGCDDAGPRMRACDSVQHLELTLCRGDFENNACLSNFPHLQSASLCILDAQRSREYIVIE